MDAARKKTRGERTIEETYQKKTQTEHILLRPDSYVGSVERQSQDHFVYDSESGRMTKRKLEYVPALYKIYDEILVNAADNMVRCPTQDTIRIEVCPEKRCISVWNNGLGLPVQMHKEHGVYVPELVFGQLLTSDNYDDSEKKVTGGRNGYGAKLTNIFSTKFVVETSDPRTGKSYKQVWEKNMTVRKDPQIKPCKGESYTCVTFWPDLARFGMESLEDDVVALMRRRAYDVAAATHGRCTVLLDGELLEVGCFKDYVNFYLEPDAFRVCQVVNDRWEVAVGLTDGSGFQQVSFVNSISTSRGGTHVNYVSDQLVGAILDKVNKAKEGGKALAVKREHVKGYLWVFVNCLIENPAFDSQTKDTLTSKRERFGSDCKLPNELMEAVVESGVVDMLTEWSKAMGKNELAQHLNRSDYGMQKRLFGVHKLEDANKAGTKESADCTLILTEGDSAKALAVAGLGIIGRDHYGVFPLRGKLRNVRELTAKQMLENREIDQLLKIMALDASKEYADVKGLRYGSIMVMTDQDFDGSHIKGLIINFIQSHFPTLLKVPGFLKEFVTPIVKVTKGEEVHTFFTIPEYEAWKEENNDGKGWESKYYKGLGTSTSQEAREYFSEIQDHEIKFEHTGPEEDGLIDMAFRSTRSDDRKKWILTVEKDTCVDHSQPVLSYSDFINKELSLFAKYDVERAIPSVVDGLKPGQRKVLFGCFKKKIAKDIKVAQLSGYVAEQSAYHHGEASLQGTIVGMAQNFVGSNNINLLMPQGQFGTRLAGGKDHAAARYIFTRLSKVTRLIFPVEDDAVLEQQKEEGMLIEPAWYCPVLPMVLVNGADGIGTGWSTSVPNYNPRDVIANIRRYLRREELEPMLPWYRGFQGTIKPIVSDATGTTNKYETMGVAQKRGRVKLEITELPIRKWTQDYKEFLLEQLPKQDNEKRALIQELREYHTENSVHFSLAILPDKLAEAERRGFEKVFHLRSTLATSNMWLFDTEGKIKKYEAPEEIIREFASIRLEVYNKRKTHMLAKMAVALGLIDNRLRFVRLVVSGTLEVEKRKAAELCAEMRRHGLQRKCEIENPETTFPQGQSSEDTGSEGYKYLLSMKLWSLTDDKIEELERKHREKTAEIEELRGTSLETLWEHDLVKLEEGLDQCDAEDKKEAEEAAKMRAKVGGDELLVNKQCVLVLTSNFRAKRVRTSEWKARRRGAKAAQTKKRRAKKGDGEDEDEGEPEGDEEAAEGEEEEEEKEALAGVFCCHDFDALLVFSEKGMVYMIQALDVPLVKKASAQGALLTEFLPELGDKQRITALVTVPQKALKDQSDEFVVLVTANGMAKKCSLDRFRGLRPGKGIQCINLKERDELRWAHRASTNSALILVSRDGFLLRASLGQDWSQSSLKGPGRPVMKFKPGDRLASCDLSPLTPKEIATAAAVVAKRKELRQKILQQQAQANQQAAGDQDEEDDMGADDEEAPKSAPAVAAASPKATPRRASQCDDDDSDNGAPPAAAPAAAAAAAMDEDGDGEDGADAEEEGAGAAEGEDDGAEGEEQPAAGGRGLCALVVTEFGMGLRMPLNCKRIGLRRKGGTGLRAIKLADGRRSDQVVCVRTVSGRDDHGPPQKPVAEWMMYRRDVVSEEKMDDTEALPASQPAVASAADPPPEAPEGEADGEAKTSKEKDFFKVKEWVDRFQALPEEKKQEYRIRHEEEKLRHAEALAEYKRQDIEEVLLGTTSGAISRVVVGTVPVVLNRVRGRVLAKLNHGDAICTVSLLSSMDDEKEEEKVEEPLQHQQSSLGGAESADPARPAAPRAVGEPRKRAEIAAEPYLGKRAHLSHLAISPKASRPIPLRNMGWSSGKVRPHLVRLNTFVKPRLRLLVSEPKTTCKVEKVNLAGFVQRCGVSSGGA